MPACQWPYVPSGGKVSPRRDWIVPDRLLFFFRNIFHSPPFYSFFIRTDYFFSIYSLLIYFLLFEIRHYVRSPFSISIFSPIPNLLFRNSTVLSSGTYWGQFEEISKYNTQLNVAERLWAAWYAWMQNDVLATGIMSFVMHEAVYFGRSLPWIFIDTLGLFNRYKIQGVSDLLNRRRCFPRFLTTFRTRPPRSANSGTARNLCSSVTSPLNYLRFGKTLGSLAMKISPDVL